MPRCLVGAAALWSAAMISPGSAQLVRRDELAKVQEALGDPDPMQRLANMEAIVKRGDPLQNQVAIRTAFASDDPDLRGLGMQALFASVGEITFEITLPADAQREYDTSRADERKPRRSRAEDRYVGHLQRGSFRLHLVLDRYVFPQGTGTVAESSHRPASFVIKGSRFSSLLQTQYGRCYVDFAPTTKPALDGTLACAGSWPQLPITARPF